MNGRKGSKIKWKDGEGKNSYIPKKIVMKEAYTQVKITITNKNIDKLKRPAWHRDFREHHVGQIENSILKGNHWSEAITINRKGAEFTIVNGNHRIEALRRILKRTPNFKIEARLTVYDNLSDKAELELYEIVNKTKAENLLDRVKAHCLNSYFVKEAAKGFPIRPLFRRRSKAELDSMPITSLVIPYITRGQTILATGGGRKILTSINELEEGDVDNIRDYCQFYIDCFGTFTGGNMYANYNLWSTFAKIYYNNIGVTVSKKEMKQRVKKVLARHTGDINYHSQGGWDSRVQLYKFLLAKLSSRKPLYDVELEVAKNGKEKKE